MKKSAFIVIPFLFFFVLSCNNKDFEVTAVKVSTSDFETTSDDTWAGGVAGYPASMSLDSVRFSAARDTLPTGLDTTNYALHVYSRNLSGAMFTYIKKKIGGLAKNTLYEVEYEIDLGTNYPESVPAGNSVYLKAGASSVEPAVDASRNFNLDKGIGASGGKQMAVLGNVSNDLLRVVYVNVQRTNIGQSVVVQSDGQGYIWLCVGVESRYSGATDLYFDKVKATIRL